MFSEQEHVMLQASAMLPPQAKDLLLQLSMRKATFYALKVSVCRSVHKAIFFALKVCCIRKCARPPFMHSRLVSAAAFQGHLLSCQGRLVPVMPASPSAAAAFHAQGHFLCTQVSQYSVPITVCKATYYEVKVSNCLQSHLM